MSNSLVLITHALPLGSEPFPAPVVVASIISDARFTGRLAPGDVLHGLAHRMGLLDYEIVASQAHALPGHQLQLPFPT